MYFDETDLNDDILDALDAMNFTTCTPIQEHSITPILEGHDLLGVAQTGTGKTAAYLLPILSRLSDGGYPHDAVNCVIMSPTRELAQQIDQAMQGFSYYVPVSSVAVYGGNDGIRYAQECRGFDMGADVVIATPGRLISHISLGNVDLSRVSFFVLDEADRMLDMGFIDDIMQIYKQLPADCQTILFSATMPEKIQELAGTILKNPVKVMLEVSKPADKIVQNAFICHETQKMGLIRYLFSEQLPQRVLLFAGKKQKVKEVARALRMQFRQMAATRPEFAEVRVGEMHSDLSQPERDDIMHEFRSGRVHILVATDIVSRGIDIDDIRLVINYDVPHDNEDYVHRIGRTARAGADGMAITFVSREDQLSFAAIERFIEREVNKLAVPDWLGEAPEYESTRRGSSSRRSGHGRKGHGGSGRKRGGEGGKRETEGNKRGSEGRQRPARDAQAPADASKASATPAPAAPKTAEGQGGAPTAAEGAKPEGARKKKRHRPSHHKRKPSE